MMELLGLFVAFFFFAAIACLFALVVSRLRNVNQWARTYKHLSKRYGGKGKGFKKGANRFATGFGLKTPSLEFDYGRTYCWLKNRKSSSFSSGRATELMMKWPDRKFRLVVATSPRRVHQWGKKDPFREITIGHPQFDSSFHIASNRSEVAKRMLNESVQWQIEQLRRHMGNQEIVISIERGRLLVSTPGYIKVQQELEDFVQFSLNLFDQLMLVDAQGIEFMNDKQASVVCDVKCPICSEEILQDMVVCKRCKTPHCCDCWEYNGQCATFACNEKRFIATGEVQAYKD